MKKRHPRTSFSGFTLMELLVVISIISMLMSILMPSLKNAKEQGRRVVCLANLRQLSYAWFNYNNDYNDIICSADTRLNHQEDWAASSTSNHFNNWVSNGPGLAFNQYCGTEKALEDGALWPYLEMYGVYKCESHFTPYFRSYSISHIMGSRVEIDGEKCFYKATNIITPGQKVIFADSDPIIYDSENYTEPFQVDLYGYKPVHVAEERFRSPFYLTARHLEGLNFSFGDSHAEYVKLRDQRTRKIFTEGICPDDCAEASISNPDIAFFIKAFRGKSLEQF